MSKGENIFKRKDGRWEARYIKGYELSGKIKYGFCYGKTYKEAKEKVTKFKVAMASGSPLPAVGSRHRFAFYCDEWLRLRKTKVKEATYIKYDILVSDRRLDDVLCRLNIMQMLDEGGLLPLPCRIAGIFLKGRCECICVPRLEEHHVLGRREGLVLFYSVVHAVFPCHTVKILDVFILIHGVQSLASLRELSLYQIDDIINGQYICLPLFYMHTGS